MQNIKQAENTSVPNVVPEQIEFAKKRTQRLSLIESISSACMFGFGDNYFAPFALFLNAGNQAMAILGTLPPAIGSLAQIIGASIAERMGKRKPIIVIFVFLQALCYLPLFWIPFFFRSIGLTSMIIMATLCAFCINLTGPPWLSMMSDVVPETKRGRYFAMRLRFWVVAIILSMVGGGIILWWCNLKNFTWLGFGIIFTTAAAARIYSSYLLNLHYDPPFNPSKEDYFSFWDFIRKTPQSNFAKFTLAVASINGLTNIAGPFFSVYMLRDLNWNYIQFTVNTIGFLVGQLVFISWWGMMCDRHGNRSVLIATSLIIPLIPLPWAFLKSFSLLMCLQFISGSVWSGFNLAASNFILDACTPKKRPRATSYYTAVNSFFSLIAGSVIGAFLAEHLVSDYNFGFMHITFISSLPAVFIVSGILRFIPAILIMPYLKEVGETEPIKPAQILWRFTTGEPIFSQLQQLVNLLSAPIKRINGSDNQESAD
ncbi:MAG: MFS transporter [Kiritimatiellae bacterium]|nr:MFS transporter [Kiritimatiellia bacterium]